MSCVAAPQRAAGQDSRQVRAAETKTGAILPKSGRRFCAGRVQGDWHREASASKSAYCASIVNRSKQIQNRPKEWIYLFVPIHYSLA
jgi:hypothetical protein